MMRLLFFLCLFTAPLCADIFSLGEALNIPRHEMEKMCHFIDTTLPHMAENSFIKEETGLFCTIERDPKTHRTFIHTDVWLSDGFCKRVTKSILYNREHPELVARCLAPISDAYELKIARDLQDMPGIVEARALIARHNTIELLLKFYNAKSIRTIYKEKTHTFTLPEKIKIARELLLGLRSIHQKSYIHRDLHSANCLIHIEGEAPKRIVKAAIADFGRSLKQKNCRNIFPAVVLRYRPPEAFHYKKMKSHEYRAVDVFSLGCVLYKLFYEKEPPWFAAHLQQKKSSKEKLKTLLFELNAKRRRELRGRRATLQDQFEYMILTMVHENPKYRKTAAAYCNERIFKP